MDANNIGPSYIISMGSHTGGQLWTQDQGVLDCYDNWKLFNGNRKHATRPFSTVPLEDGPGERISFIVFAHGLYNKLKVETVGKLNGLGFSAARSDGKDEDLFEAFRIRKSYLSDEHNAAFRACLAQRNVDSKKPVENAVAVECDAGSQ